MKILLVEDDDSLGATLRDRLNKEGYQVEWATTARRARELFHPVGFDLLILDIGLPDGSGFELAQEFRKTSKTPLLFMTALNSAENRLAGFEMGAEEFIPKPFHLKELLIRIRHVLETHSLKKEIQSGTFTIDLEGMSIRLPNGRVEFPQARDFQVLRYLIEISPRVVSRDELLDKVWGEDKFPSQRTVDNTIVRLRQLLGDNENRFIRSVRGVGYQWSALGEKQNE